MQTVQFDIVYATTSICFRLIHIRVILSANVLVIPVRILENDLAIPNYLTDRKASVLINTVPSVVESLLNEKTDLSRVRMINMAGEPKSRQGVSERLKDTINTEVRNLYGPTEAHDL